MNYLVDLQTSKAQHCTGRCRGNPSGTFPGAGGRVVWAGRGRGAERTWPKGRERSRQHQAASSCVSPGTGAGGHLPAEPPGHPSDGSGPPAPRHRTQPHFSPPRPLLPTPCQKFSAWEGGEEKKRQTLGSVSTGSVPLPAHLCFSRHFSSQPRSEISDHFQQFQM